MDLSRVAWEDDDGYWRANYRTRPYGAAPGRNYEFYRPAYLFGYEAAHRFPEHEWDEIAPDLVKAWSTYDPTTSAAWDEIAGAARDGWDRVVARRSAMANG